MALLSHIVNCPMVGNDSKSGYYVSLALPPSACSIVYDRRKPPNGTSRYHEQGFSLITFLQKRERMASAFEVLNFRDYIASEIGSWYR